MSEVQRPKERRFYRGLERGGRTVAVLGFLGALPTAAVLGICASLLGAPDRYSEGVAIGTMGAFLVAGIAGVAAWSIGVGKNPPDLNSFDGEF